MQSIKRPFPGQKPDEKVILFVRKHWISFWGFIGLTLGMVFIPLIFLIILIVLLPDFFIAFRSPIILTGSAYLLFVLAFFLVGWIDYYFDIVIVTDSRIVDIHQRGLFSRDIDELDLLHVEDVSAKTKGVLATLFHYGNVYVQTAGTNRNFEFESVPYPQKMSRQIMILYDRVVSLRQKKLKTIDNAEGLGPRHIHPSGDLVKKRFGEDLKKAKEADIEVSFQKESLAKTEYQKQIEKDRENLEGEIPQDDQVDFSDGPRKY